MRYGSRKTSWLRRLGLGLAIPGLIAGLLLFGLTSGASAAGSVGSPVLALSSTSATATQVTYSVNFVATDGLTSNSSTITLAGPAGTLFPSSNGCSPYNVVDGTTGSGTPCLTAALTNGGASVTITSPINASPGDTVMVVANAVTNSATTGAQSLSVSTSTDPTPVALAFSLTAPSAVKGVVALSATAATATQVTYTVHFLAANALTTGFSTITLAGRAGLIFASSNGCSPYVVEDETTGAASSCVTPVLSNGGATVTLTMPTNASRGDVVMVTANGVANPSATGAQTLSVSTTSDPKATALPFSLTAASAVKGVVSLSSTSATATQVAYTVDFIATNALTGNFSTITLAGPTGTFFSSTNGCNSYVVLDVTTGQSNCPTVAMSNGGATVTITDPHNIAVTKGDVVKVTANGVTNTSATGAQTLSLSTSSDPKAAALPFSLTAPTAVVGVAELSSTSVAATQVSYTVSFLATNALTTGFSTITLAGPSGLLFAPVNGCTPYVVEDETTGQGSTCPTATLSNGGATVTLTMPVNASRGDVVKVVANGVTNPSTTGAQKLSLSTSSDPKAASLPFGLTAPSSVGSANLALSSTLHGATNVTYTVSFAATNALTGNFSTITLAAPAGTIFAPGGGCSSYVVRDNASGQQYTCPTVNVTNGGAIVTITMPYFMSANRGDVLIVTAGGVTNTSTTGAQTLSVSTSADPKAVAIPFTIT